jgi:hypothetical protein
MRRSAIVTLLLALSVPLVLAQSDTSRSGYAVVPGHPRVLLTAELIPQVVKRCGPGGSCEAGYQKRTQYLIGQISVEYGALARQFKERNRYGPELALAYVVETKSGRDGKIFLDHFRRVWGSGGAEVGQDVLNDAIVYDWMHAGFTSEERIAFGNRLGKHLRVYTNKPEITLDGGTYWYNQSWATTLEWARDSIGFKTGVALAILGEGTDHEDDARAWVNSFAKRMPEEFVKKFDQFGGIWPEGPQHGSITFSPFLTWEAWRTATGQDLFSKVAPTGFHRELPYWPVYDNVPHTGYMAHMDDVGSGSFRGLAGYDMIRALHAARYGDGLTQKSTMDAVSSGQSSWADALWHNPQAPIVDKKTFPTAYHFQGAGRVYTRTQWGGPDDTWAAFSAGPFWTSYGTHGENGTFQITKQGTLVGDAGISHRTSRMSINQNVVLVYDPNEKFNAHGDVLRNDGGPQIPYDWHVREPSERGKILAYQHTGAYTYVGADLTNAYGNAGNSAKTGSRKMESCTRQFLHMRGDPEFFVVYDRVVASDASFPKTWIIHVTGEPTISAAGEKISASDSGPGFETFPGSDTVLARVREGEKPSQDVPWRTDRRGALVARTLLPKDARITKRGGKGFDMWGNPHDPMAGNMTDSEPDMQTDMDICLWRLEVEPSRNAKGHCFLHVLIPCGDAKGKSDDELTVQASAFSLVETSTHDGVRLKLGGKTWEVSFPREGPIGASFKVKAGSGKAVSTPLPTAIQPNAMPKGLAISRP